VKVIKKSVDEVKLEDAHGGAGGRKLFVKEDELVFITNKEIPVMKLSSSLYKN